MFNHQKALAHKVLMKLQCQPFTSNFMHNALLGEFTNIDSIYQLYQPTIQTTIQLFRTEQVFNKLTMADNPWPKGIKESTTLLVRCITVANRESHYE